MSSIRIESSDFDVVAREFRERVIDVYGQPCWDIYDSGTLQQIAIDMANNGTTFEFGNTGLYLHQIFDHLSKNNK